MKQQLFLGFALALFGMQNIAAAEYAGGNGTYESPYLIETPEQLDAIRNIKWADVKENPPYFRLENDLDLSGFENWTPLSMGNEDNTGGCYIHFDGNGHIIKNMHSAVDKYSSLFGILKGTCKNLGLVNVDVAATGSGAGAFAGYLGLRNPTGIYDTGTIENCFSTGKVSASDAAGGIVGNIGKNFESAQSFIRNCYSTCDVTATRVESKGARCAGIAGIAFVGSAVENCYATGTSTASQCFGAGGVVGHAQVDLVGCVAMNKKIVNFTEGPIGRIASYMAQVDPNPIPQGVNCWASSSIVMDNGGLIIDNPEHTGEVVNSYDPYDGETKDPDFLSQPIHYFQDLGWPMAGENQVWSQQASSEGYPMLLWVANRPDHGDFDGISSVKAIDTNDVVRIFVQSGKIVVRSSEMPTQIRVFDYSGKSVFNGNSIENFNTMNLKGLYIVQVYLNNTHFTQKVIL